MQRKRIERGCREREKEGRVEREMEMGRKRVGENYYEEDKRNSGYNMRESERGRKRRGEERREGDKGESRVKWPTSIENNFIWIEIKWKCSVGKLEINANKNI